MNIDDFYSKAYHNQDSENELENNKDDIEQDGDSQMN